MFSLGSNGKGSMASGSKVGAFHMVNAMAKKCLNNKGRDSKPRQLLPIKEEDRGKKSSSKSTITRLMFDVKVNGKPIRALVDMGATHNFIASTKVERLWLSLDKEISHNKVVKSVAQPIHGIVKSATLRVSTWEERMDFTIVPRDDFQALLGLDFLRRMKMAFMPFSNSMCDHGDKPCPITARTTNKSDKFSNKKKTIVTSLSLLCN